jgi:hypothetical protein
VNNPNKKIIQLKDLPDKIQPKDKSEEIQLLDQFVEIQNQASQNTMEFAMAHLMSLPSVKAHGKQEDAKAKQAVDKLFKENSNIIKNAKAGLDSEECYAALKAFQDQIENDNEDVVTLLGLITRELGDCMRKFSLVKIHAEHTNDTSLAEYFKHFEPLSNFQQQLSQVMVKQQLQ